MMVDRPFRMVFYCSPFVFLAIVAVLILGGAAGLVGLALGAGMPRRVQAALAVSVCVGSFASLPGR